MKWIIVDLLLSLTLLSFGWLRWLGIHLDLLCFNLKIKIIENHRKKPVFYPFDVSTPFRKLENSDSEPENDDFQLISNFHFGPCLGSVFVFWDAQHQNNF